MAKCSHSIAISKAPGPCIFMRFPDDLHASILTRNPTFAIGRTKAVPGSPHGARRAFRSGCSKLSGKEEKKGKNLPIVENNFDNMKKDRGAETQSKSSQEATSGQWSWAVAPPAGQSCRWFSFSVTFKPGLCSPTCVTCISATQACKPWLSLAYRTIRTL